MNNTSDFTSNFWNIYVAVIIIVSFIALAWLLISQNKVKKTDKVETMGHSWDGIEEWNNPLPRWWFYLFVITVVFSIVYLILYPGFASFKGVLGWTSHNQYEAEMKAAAESYEPVYAQFKGKSIEQISLDPQAREMGRNLFQTYCIQCHGSDARGTKGFPDLTDNDWLWGGHPQDIMETIRDGRIGIMQPYGGLDPFPEEKVKDVINYIWSLSVNENTRKKANPQRIASGKEVFESICVSCHMEDGKGAVGTAPNLTDDVWLWGRSEKDMMNTIQHGHTNQMPAWNKFLIGKDSKGQEDDSKLRILAAYVFSFSHPDAASVKAYEDQVKAEQAAQQAAEAEAQAAEAPAAQ